MLGGIVSALVGSGGPDVPAFTPLKLGKVTDRAMAANAANLPEISAFTSEINRMNQEQKNAALELALPGFGGIRDTTTKNVSDFISKDGLSKSIADTIARSSAFKALSGGFSSGGTRVGSSMESNALARNLGLGELEFQQAKIDTGTRWATAANAFLAGQYDPSQLLWSTKDAAQVEMFNKTGTFQRDWVKNQSDWYNSTTQMLNRTGAQTDASL